VSGRLEGKIAIVTGAGSGIGKAAAALFAEEGATVIAADLKGTQITVDAGDEDQVAALVAATVERCGGLDVMFANAGISGGFAGLFEQDAAEWQRILKTNLIGPFVAIKHAAPAIAQRGGGSIICTASVAGLRSGAGGPAYSASKAGVINLVQVAAQQLSGSGVRVNAICPGLIETGMTQPIFEAARSAGKEDRIGRLNPLRRGGVPQEVAQAALFLACAESSYVNGHALIVDGGLSSSHPFTRQDYGKSSF
jgi:NAD(P)-dependent dehydrogenase (short-subunit alcohol dehydrogenase family)